MYSAPTVSRTLSTYVKVGRAAAVRRAIREGRYDAIDDIIWVTEVRRARKGTFEVVQDDGVVMSLNTMKSATRRRLFWLRDGRPEPMALWLNEAERRITMSRGSGYSMRPMTGFGRQLKRLAARQLTN